MRQVHPSYNIFMNQQVPKYGKTFVDWFYENEIFGGINFLDELNRRTYAANSNHGYSVPSCYFDFFTKKLILCKSILHMSITDYNYPPLKYGMDVVADIMDLYEE